MQERVPTKRSDILMRYAKRTKHQVIFRFRELKLGLTRACC